LLDDTVAAVPVTFNEVKETVVINENELLEMSEFIKNLDVTFEIVSPIKDLDFMFHQPEVFEKKS